MKSNSGFDDAAARYSDYNSGGWYSGSYGGYDVYDAYSNYGGNYGGGYAGFYNSYGGYA